MHTAKQVLVLLSDQVLEGHEERQTLYVVDPFVILAAKRAGTFGHCETQYLVEKSA